MGFLEVFRKKTPRTTSQSVEPIRTSFDNVARDISQLNNYSQETRDLMSQWNQYFSHNIGQLHQHLSSHVENTNQRVRDVHNKVDSHNSKLVEHDSHIASHASQIEHHKRILDEHHANHAQNNVHKHDIIELQSVCERLTKVNEHQAAIISSLNKDVKELESNLGTMANRYSDAMLKLAEQIKHMQTLQEKLHATPVEPKSESEPKTRATSPRSVQKENESESMTLKSLSEDLTTAEKSMLFLLASTDQKLSYRDLAVNYGRSPSTVKNVICRLKSKKIPLNEITDADGTKRYYLEASFKKILQAGKV